MPDDEKRMYDSERRYDDRKRYRGDIKTNEGVLSDSRHDEQPGAVT
jgi:hypothetical protein